jgi:serine/threonine-protein kinase
MKHKSFSTLLITPKKRHGFTVIELVVVIVVIGILAAIAIVVYSGVTRRAVETSMQSDLDGASSALEFDNRQNGSYPSNSSSANGGQGLVATSGNTLTYVLKPYGYCLATVNSGTPNTYVYKSSTRITQSGTCDSVVSTSAGSGTNSFADGAGAVAQFSHPEGIAVDSSGNTYVADTNNQRIRVINTSNVVSTLAGSATSGFADGSGALARFNYPQGVAVNSSGTIYVADTSNNRIRSVTAGGVVSTLAGSGSNGYVDGGGTTAQFSHPEGIAVDSSGTVYVADYGNHRIRKITVAGVVSTLAGTGVPGFVDGAGAVAQFNYPQGIALDMSGTVYIADSSNNRIRTITTSGMVSTLAGSGTGGSLNGTGIGAQFLNPSGVAVDSSGIVYVADYGNQQIRKITAGGVVSTLAGTGTAGSTNGTGQIATFYNAQGIALDTVGNVYIADSSNHQIRIITQ